MTDVTVVGNISEPELRFTPDGKPVLKFSLAENHRKKQGNEWVDDGTTWRKVTVWEDKAETLANALSKGDRVIVVGSERMKQFTARDGGTGQSLELTAKHVGIIPRQERRPQQSQQGWGGQQQGGWGQSPQQAQDDPWAQPQSDSVPF